MNKNPRLVNRNTVKSKNNQKLLVKQKVHDSPNSISLLPHISKFPKRHAGMKKMLVFDLALNVTTPSSTASITQLFVPTQGVALNMRVGDAVEYRQMELSYTCNAANVVVFSNLRVLLFQWHTNSAIAAPVVADIFSTPADTVNALLIPNFSDQYTVFYDQLHSFAGVAASPSSSANQSAHKIFSPGSFRPNVIFAAGQTTGSNLIFLLTISDQAVTFPNLSLKFRASYEEP